MAGDVAVVPRHLLVSGDGDQFLQLGRLADDGQLHGLPLSANKFEFTDLLEKEARADVKATEAHLQVPGLLHILPHHLLLHVVKRAGADGRIWGPQAGFPQEAHQSVRVFAVELAELGRAAVRLPSSDAVSPIQLLLYGVMVELQVPHDRQNVAPQAADALTQQEESVVHPGQLQVLLGVCAADAAVEEWQLGRRVGGHAGSCGEELGVQRKENRPV